MAQLHPALVAHLNNVAHAASRAGSMQPPLTMPVFGGSATKPAGLLWRPVGSDIHTLTGYVSRFDDENSQLPDGVYYVRVVHLGGFALWIQVARTGGRSRPTATAVQHI